MTDDEIRELLAYGEHTADAKILSMCALALAPQRGRSTSVDLARSHCESMYQRVIGTREWTARHLPYGAFAVAEMIAQFVLDQAAGWEHIEQVHDALVEVARKIRTADWCLSDQTTTDRTTEHLRAARASEHTREVGRTTLDAADRRGAKP